MNVQIKELCDARNIKSAYRLAQLAELTMPTAYRAFENDIKQFTPETLEKLCTALECTRIDVLGYASPVAVKTSRKKSGSTFIADEQKMLDEIGGKK